MRSKFFSGTIGIRLAIRKVTESPSRVGRGSGEQLEWREKKRREGKYHKRLLHVLGTI